MNKFDRTQMPSMATEEWGEKAGACWSMTSGKFIPKEDKGYYPYLDKGITYPGNLKPEVADEKDERY